MSSFLLGHWRQVSLRQLSFHLFVRIRLCGDLKEEKFRKRLVFGSRTQMEQVYPLLQSAHGEGRHGGALPLNNEWSFQYIPLELP